MDKRVLPTSGFMAYCYQNSLRLDIESKKINIKIKDNQLDCFIHINSYDRGKKVRMNFKEIIVYFESEDGGTLVRTKDGKEYNVSESVYEIDKLIAERK